MFQFVKKWAALFLARIHANLNERFEDFVEYFNKINDDDLTGWVFQLSGVASLMNKNGFLKPFLYKEWRDLSVFQKWTIVRRVEKIKRSVYLEMKVARQLIAACKDLKKLNLPSAREDYEGLSFYVKLSGEGRFHREGCLIIESLVNGEVIFQFSSNMDFIQEPEFLGKKWLECSIYEKFEFLHVFVAIQAILKEELERKYNPS